MQFEAASHLIKPSQQEMEGYFSILNAKCPASSACTCVHFLQMGSRIVRVVNHVPSLERPIEDEFGFCLTGARPVWDAEIRVWQDDVRTYIQDFAQTATGLFITRPEGSFIHCYVQDGELHAYHAETKTGYVAASDFSPAALSKRGHLFVQHLNRVVQGPRQALLHAAAVGVGSTGALICARGGRGKTTLAVSSLAAGLNYVADDYLILEKNGAVTACPIYSIIALSPEMRKRMPGLQAAYLWPHSQKEKQVLNIQAHRDRVVRRLPISVVLFPVISPVSEPSIRPMERKGTAIVQLVHSTVAQMGRQKDHEYVKQLISFVQDLDFYQMNLSSALDKNVQCLEHFLKERDSHVSAQ